MNTPQKRSSKILFLWVVFFVGILLSLKIRLYPSSVEIDTGKSTTVTTKSGSIITRSSIEQQSLPTQLRIPKIGVDTVLESVWLTPDGAMDVPKNYKHAAWYNNGPHPGAIGSAVINGHYSGINGIPTVFADLHLLKSGDLIEVENTKGEITSFKVKSLQTFKENSDAQTIFGSSDGKAHLNIITCQWIWDTTLKSYPLRLVVFTELVAL